MVRQRGPAALRWLLPMVGRPLPGAFWWLSLTTFTIWSSRLLVPFLMVLLTRQLGWSVAVSSAALAAYGVGGVVAVLLSGTVLDRVGPRRALISALVGAVLSTVLLALVREHAAVVGALVALGACLNAVGPASSSLVAGLVPAEARLQGFALNYWVVNLGYAVAPALGALLLARGFAALFVAQACGLGLAGLLAWRRLPRAAAAPADGARGGPRSSPLTDPGYLAFLASNLVFQLVYVQCTVTLPVVTHRDGLSSTAFGLLLTLNGALLLVVQLPAAAWLVRWPRSWSLVAAAVLNGIGFGATALAHTWGGYAATVVVWTLAEVVNAPVTMSVSADLAPLGQTGRYLGTFAATWSLALVVGPALGGAILDRLGPTTLWGACVLASLACAAVRSLTAPAQERRLARGARPVASPAGGTAVPTS